MSGVLPVELLQQLAYVDPALVSGLLSRGLGVCFLVALGSLYPQLVPIAGRRGLLPIHDALRAIERDFAAPQRFAYFPTLLWFNASDTALRGLCAVGIVAALAIIVGGSMTPVAFAVCYAVYLSLDRAMTLIYPWDCVLFEAGFWGMFLPATLPWQLAAVSGSAPAVLWVYRLLLFRVLFGFGKHKFIGSTAQDAGFMQGFLATQPLPTRIGWLSQKLPLGLLKLALIMMFVVEIPVQFAVFFPGPWSAVAGIVSILLMLGIWLTGNYGHFNLVTIVVAFACFDSASAARLDWGALFASDLPGSTLALHALFVVHCVLVVFALPFNSWCALTWTMWSPWRRVRPQWLTAPIIFARALQPLRLVHSYGIFSPLSTPAARFTAIAEATWDGEQWYELTHPLWPTTERSVPKFCAPHHERFDQAVVYESIGLNESSPYRNILGRWDPYGHGGVPLPLLWMRRMLRGDVPGTRFYDRSRERQWGAPGAVRARMYMLEPATLTDLREHGSYWRRELIGPHLPAITLNDGYWDSPEPTPELWHYDDMIWLKRSRMGALMARARAGVDAHALVQQDAPELTTADLEAFWQGFVPLVHARHQASFAGVRASVRELRETYGRAQLHRFERIANRYALWLFAKLEPAFLAASWIPERRGADELSVPSTYHLRTLCMAIVAKGQERYDAVMASPQLAAAESRELTTYSGHQLQVVFRYESLVYHAQKLRLLAAMTQQSGRPTSAAQNPFEQRVQVWLGRAWGSLPFVDFLRTQFMSHEDMLDVPEHWPRFHVTADARVIRAPSDDTVGYDINAVAISDAGANK